MTNKIKIDSTSFIPENPWTSRKTHCPEIIKKINKEREIDLSARKIIFLENHEREKEHSLLLQERARSIYHIPVGGLKENVLFFNIKQIGLAPTPICPAYNKMQLPTISTYHSIGSNIANIQLDSSCIAYVPKKIMETISHCSKTQMEFFWTAIDGRWFESAIKINLCTHPWSHPNALPDDDICEDVLMGIFPEIGFKQIDKNKDTYPISCYRLSPMQVHVHSNSKKKTGNHENMLYSPNNAHFEKISGSPFGVLWSVTQQKERIAITKMLVIFDYEDPIGACLINSIRKPRTLESHFQELKKTEKAIPFVFQKVVELLEKNDPKAIEEFRKLPLAFQYGIFKETWTLLGSLHNIHTDFGRASFEEDPSLDKKYHCSNEQRIQAIENYKDYLKHLLIDSQYDLLLRSQPLTKAKNVLNMIQCAELLLSEEETEAEKLFGSFSQEEKEAVYFAMWQLSGCPQGNRHFGKETFKNLNRDPRLRAEALLFASTRVKPCLDQEILIEKNNEKEDIPDNPINVMIPELLPQRSLQEDNLQTLTGLLYNSEFLLLNQEEQKSQIHSLLKDLPENTRNCIYEKVYKLSNDPQKGGESWAESHVADNLDILIEAVVSTNF